MSEDRSVESDQPASLTRRSVLFGGAVGLAALGYLGLPTIRRLFVGTFEFENLATPTGFRRIAAREVSSVANPFVGVGPGDGRPSKADVDLILSDVCTALYGKRRFAPGVVPIASFSDYNCPYCRVLTQALSRLADGTKSRVDVAWHEWPIFGDISETAARAALAAERQGAYVDFHKQLMRSRFVPTDTYLQDLARRLDIDADLLLADMQSKPVAQKLAVSRGLAALFGLPGTPAMVVGRTLVVGAIDLPTLEALIARERADGPLTFCAPSKHRDDGLAMTS